MDKDNSRALVEKVTSLPGYTSSIGTKVIDVDKGRVQLELDRNPNLLQFNGFFHGGVISGLADHAAGGAATTLLPSGRIAVTIDLHVNFLKPAKGEKLTAKATVTQPGSTISVVQVNITATDGSQSDLCAIATVTLRSVDMPA